MRWNVTHEPIKHEDPLRPGYILEKKYMEPLGVSQHQLAKAIGKPQSAISEIVNGKRPITHEMAWLLGKAFDTPAKYWIDLEADYWLRHLDESRMPKVTPLYTESFVDAVRRVNPTISMIGEYVNPLTKVNVRCDECGCEWSTLPRNLRAGVKCPVCSRRRISR